jgi:hypothetical protein
MYPVCRVSSFSFSVVSYYPLLEQIVLKNEKYKLLFLQTMVPAEEIAIQYKEIISS